MVCDIQKFTGLGPHPIYGNLSESLHLNDNNDNKMTQLNNRFFFVQQALYSWSFYIINTDLPKYLNDVLHVSIEKNAIYSSVPKVLSIVVSTGSGFLSDIMMSKWHVNRTVVRKVFVVLSELIWFHFSCDLISPISQPLNLSHIFHV